MEYFQKIIAFITDLLPFLQDWLQIRKVKVEEKKDLNRLKHDLRKIPKAKKLIKRIERLHEEASENNYDSAEMLKHYKVEDFRIAKETEEIAKELPSFTARKAVVDHIEKIRKNKPRGKFRKKAQQRREERKNNEQ